MSFLPEFTNRFEKVQTEIAKGVIIERRGFIKLSVAGVVAFLLSKTSILNAEEKAKIDENSYDFKKFIEEMAPKADALIKDEKSDEEKYLKDIVEMIKKVKGLEFASKTENKIHFTSMHKVQPIIIYQIRMLPGAVLPCHDHRDYNGVIQLLEGSANLRNFNLADEKETIQNGAKFKIRETANVNAKVGDITSLARARDNIHEIIAGPEGVLFLDIFTFYKPTGGSKYLTVDKTPVDAENKIYLASWRK